MNAKTLSLDSECPHGNVNALNPAAAGVGDLGLCVLMFCMRVCSYVLLALTRPRMRQQWRASRSW